MADSKKPANQDLDQSDDLIAELARIVADDAKRASVSQSIEQRAQQPRPVEQAKPATPSFGQSGAAPTTSAFADRQEQRPQATVYAEPQDQQQQRQQQQRQEPSFSAPKAPEEVNTDKAVDPFEFDFASSYKESAAAQSTRSTAQDALDRIENAQSGLSAEFEQLVAETEQEQQVVEPIAPEPEQSGQTYGAPAEPTTDVPEYAPTSDAVHTTQPYAPSPTAPTPSPEQTVSAAPIAPEPATSAPTPPTPTRPASAPAPQADPVAYDPLAEIERLIEDTAEAPPSPAQPTYTDTPASNIDSPSNAAEAAILAAMSAARPHSDNVEAPRAQAPVRPSPEPAMAAARPAPASPYVNEEPQSPYDDGAPASQAAKKPGNKMPLYAGGLAAVLLLALGGMTLWNFIGGGQSEGDVPLVTAQNTNVKQQPETTDTGGETRSVFSALEGQSEDASSEQLVSRDDTQGASGAGVSRVITPSNSSDSRNSLTNRKVKTVTVLADGTIVTGDEASAGAQQLPNIRPNVPAVGDNQTTQSPTASTDPIADAIAGAQTPAANAGTDTATNDQATTGENLAQTAQAAPTPPARPAGLGTNRPLASAVLNNSASTSAPANSNDQPLGLVPDSQATTSAPVRQPTSAPVSTTTNAVNAPFYVQLASQRTPADAQTTVNRVTRQFASALGGQTIGVNRVDLGDRGIFYRVLVPANSIESANSICSNVKLAGGDCFVRNN